MSAQRLIEASKTAQGFNDVVALKTNADQVAGYTVEAVAAHHPAGLDLVAAPVALDVRQDAVAGVMVNPTKREDRFT